MIKIIIIAIITAMVIGAWRFLSNLKPVAFRKMARMLKKMYKTRPVYKHADAGDYSHLDIEYYNETQAWLEQQGFRLAADIKIDTLAGTPQDPKCFLRIMTGLDGIAVAAIYHAWGMRKIAQKQGIPTTKVVEFEVELAGGGFLAWSNTGDLNLMDNVPGFASTALAAGTPVGEVWTHALADLRAYLEKHPEAQPLRFASWDDVEASQQRGHALKADYRLKNGLLSEEEFVKMGGNSGDYALLQEIVRDELARDD